MPSEQRASSRPVAIVTDGMMRKALSAIRSLGKANFDVIVLGDTPLTIGFWSKFTTKRVLTPSAENVADRFGSNLTTIVRALPGAVILPMEDPTLAWVSANRVQLGAAGARFLLAPEESIAIALHKARTIEVAESLGIPCPRTIRALDYTQVEKEVSALAVGTYVVKPVHGLGSSGVAYAPPASGWREHWKRHGALIVQQRVPAEGRAIGVSALFDGDGKCAALFTHERLQQYPNSGGPSTDRQSIHEPEIAEMSLKLLKRLNWRGIAMVEWKVNPGDARPMLMEINPRFWGSLELAVRAGVDFPALYARAARGEKFFPSAQYRSGVRCRWMIPGEVLRYVSQEPTKREGFRKFFSGLPGLAEEWDRRDLRGTIATLLCTALAALNPRYWKFIRRGP